MKHLLARVALAALGADLALKLVPLPPRRALLPGVLGLTRLRNTGVAFGLLPDNPLPTLLLGALVTLALAAWMGSRALNRLEALGAGLMLGGALGNFLDRIINGFVTDYLQLLFLHFPVFNLADVAVTAGALLLMLHILLGGRKEAA